jgi:phenylacetate-coenzyme A ligase PaaK-like adenylate-forming protein
METILERFPELTHEYLFILDRLGGQDRVTVQVECRREEADPSILKEKLERELKVTTGLSMEAQILTPGTLRESLKIEERIKAKRVWDRRK